MKRILAFAAILVAGLPVSAETLSDKNVATSYSTVVDGWTYITNAAEFMLLVKQCEQEDVEEKHIRLACDIEYPKVASYYADAHYYIRYFKGVFDGMGCTISNFYIKSKPTLYTDEPAFIHELKGTGSVVRNLLFKNPDVSSHFSNAALVVYKVTGENASINNIHVEGGQVSSDEGTTGGIVHSVNDGTSISYCSFVDTRIYGDPFIDESSGVINHGFIDEATGTGCSITHCFMSISPDPRAVFSNPKATRNSGCYRSNRYAVNGTYLSEKDFKQLSVVDTTDLKSGNNVMGDGWKYTKDAMPVPEGLYYWNPNRSDTLDVGIWKSSSDHNQKGTVVPLDYGRFIDATSLKLASLIKDAFGTPVPYIINDDIPLPVGADKPIVRNRITTIAEDVFEDYLISTLKLPAGVTTIEGNAFRHHVSDGFVSNGNWRFEGNLLYLDNGDGGRLMTCVGDNEELTIDCRYCNTVADEAFRGQSHLKNLYVNTWFPTGTTTFSPLALEGSYVFSDCPSDLTVYVKDGSQTQAIIGSDVTEGYKADYDGWGKFYNEWDDDNNRLIQYFPVTRNPAGLSTLVLGYAVKLPADCWAWVATGITDNQLTLKRVGRIVPANLPVLLSYENKEGIMHLTPYEGTDVPASTQYDTENLLFRGSLDPAGQKETPSEMQSNFLTLQLHPSYPTSWDKVGFYRFDGDILPSYVAWIPMSELPANAHLAMVFDGDYEFANPTGVTDVAGQADKASAPVYNLSGQRVGSGYRGMVIRNGRKYIAK